MITNIGQLISMDNQYWLVDFAYVINQYTKYTNQWVTWICAHKLHKSQYSSQGACSLSWNRWRVNSLDAKILYKQSCRFYRMKLQLWHIEWHIEWYIFWRSAAKNNPAKIAMAWSNRELCFDCSSCSTFATILRRRSYCFGVLDE